MSALLFGHDSVVAEWVAKQAHSKAPTADYTAFGFVDSAGRLTGGCVFTGYNGTSIELSLAGRSAATRSGWTAIIQYVFGQLGCVRLQMHTSQRNKRVNRMLGPSIGNGGLGVRHEGIAKHYFGRGKDAVVYAMTIDELAAFRAKWKI